MTYFEAAIEVLRLVQRPLDYKTITQFAVNRHLLGHVGHTPDVVMGACLLRAVDRSETGALIRLPTGEFALRGWSEEILARVDQQTLPEGIAGIEFPAVNIGLLDENEALPLLENDDIQFRKAVQMRFDAVLDADDKSLWEGEAEEKTKYTQLKSELNAQHNEHYNLCAAIVKLLRHAPTPMRSDAIASMISEKFGGEVYEQSIVLAMRADNALRVSRGKRAIFTHIPPNLWTLTENFLARHILKLESRLYDMSRQLRIYSIHALSAKLRELSMQAWQQLAAIIIKTLNYTIISQCRDSESVHLFRAEESRGLTYVPVVIRVQHAKLIQNDDILQFRDIIHELGYDHGVLLTNGEISKDALNECTTRELPIYAYSARQIAPIMIDAKIGVIPNELPIVFIDNNFFEALSSHEVNAHEDNVEQTTPDEPEASENYTDALEEDVSSGEFLFDSFSEPSIS